MRKPLEADGHGGAIAPCYLGTAVRFWVLAFAVKNLGSRQIRQSQVLPELSLDLLDQALRLSRQMNHGRVITWLMDHLGGQ